MKTNDVSLLHPIFRAVSLALESRVAAAGLPIRRYEGWRDPARQADLWAFGRASGVGVPGHHKTFEQSWQSNHQWGFAEDWVWFFSPTSGAAPAWSWAPPVSRTWDDFFALVAAVGLEHLKFEEPHVQLPGFNARQALEGNMASMLSGGDASWESNLEAAMIAWGPLSKKDRYGIVQPGVPNIFDGRPAAPVPPGMVYDEERGLCLPADLSGPEVSA